MTSAEFKKFILASSTLAGTIIGVGFFSLPQITVQVGLPVMLGYFIILGSLVILIHLIFSQVALSTPDFLRLPGYAQIYLGEKGKKIAFLSMILGTYGSILAYLVIGGKFLAGLAMPILGGSELLYTFVYFSLGALLIYFGINPIAKINLGSFLVIFLIFLVLFFSGLPLFKLENFQIQGSLSNFFLPYGPILFSLWGASMIPEIEEMLGKNKKLLSKVVIASLLFSVFFYLFFIFLIVGISGAQTSGDAISGLKNFLGNRVVGLGLLLGLITTFTSFLALGLTLRRIFSYDFKVSPRLSFILACFVPLILFVLGFQDFTKIIGLVGSVMLGIEVTLILLMYRKLKPEKKFLTFLLISVFLIGIVYELIFNR